MKHTRIVAALAASGCMLGLLAGCSSSPSSTSTVSSGGASSSGASGEANLVFSWWGNQTRNDLTAQVIDLYMEQNPGITVDGQFSEWGDYWNKLATSAAGNSLPDILQMDYAYIQQYVDSGLLLDLTPYIESGALDVSNISDSVMASGQVDGATYAMVAGTNAPTVFYNKTLLEENGIEVKNNMTLDEFMDVCREVNEKTGVKTQAGYLAGENINDYFLRASGKQMYTADGKLAIESAEDVLPFFEFYETGIEEGWLIDPTVFMERNTTSTEEDPLVMGESPEQRSWCTWSFTNSIQAFADSATDFEIGMLTWPSADPTASNYLKPAMFFSVSSQSKNPDAAVAFLNWLINSEDCNNILLAERGVPATSKVMEAIQDKVSDEQKQVFAYINDVVTPNCSPISVPNPAQAPEVNEKLNSLQEQVLYGEMDAQTAAEEFYAAAVEIMGE